jgi:hypothetical protein
MTTALRRCVAPSVPLSLDLPERNGSTFHIELRLSFDFNALAAFMKQTGINPLEGNVWERPSPVVLRALFWAALLAEQPEYDSEDGLRIAGSYMRPDSAVAIAEATLRAYLASTATANPTEPAPAEMTTGPAGLSFGPLPAMTSASRTTSSGA